MLKKILTIMAMLSLVLAGSWSESLDVIYLDGDVAWFEENQWQPELEIGDSISDEALLQLEEGAVVELAYRKTTFTLFASGSYKLKSLINQQTEVSDWNLNSMLSQKMAFIFNEEHMTKMGTAVMGVRQKKMNNRFNEVEWIVEEDEDPLAESILLINAGKYKQAIILLDNLAGKMDKDLEQEYLYYSGLAQLKGGSKGKAISLLAKVKFDPVAPYNSDLILIKGKILLESLAYKEAQTLFNLYLSTMPGGENGQEVNFMAGLCANALGDTKTALRHFEAARQLNPDTATGHSAGDWIKKISGR